MRRNMVILGTLLVIVAVTVGVWLLRPSGKAATVDLVGLEAHELLAQYSQGRVDGIWPKTESIRTNRLQFVETTTASDGARVDHYRIAKPEKPGDSRIVTVQVYPGKNLSRVEMRTPAS